jgi:CBS-domain-containing membrane protein
VVTRADLLRDWIAAALGSAEDDEPQLTVEPIITFDLIQREPITAYPWEPCRVAAERMAQHKVGRLVVVAADNPKKLVGIITRSDLLKPRARQFEEEFKRERFLLRGLKVAAPEAGTSTRIQAGEPR